MFYSKILAFLVKEMSPKILKGRKKLCIVLMLYRKHAIVLFV